MLSSFSLSLSPTRAHQTLLSAPLSRSSLYLFLTLPPFSSSFCLIPSSQCSNAFVRIAVEAEEKALDEKKAANTLKKNLDTIH
jgi:hypothetical protein